MFEWYLKANKLLENLVQKEEEALLKGAEVIAKVIENGGVVHAFGTGHSHMIGLEMFIRSGGLGCVNAMLDPFVLNSNGADKVSALEKISGVADTIYDDYDIRKGEVIIITSNSGRNSVPVEMAERAKKEGVYVICITSLEQSRKYESKAKSGNKLYEVSDLIIDNHVPSGDAIVDFDGVGVGSFSTMAGVTIANIMITEALKILKKNGYEEILVVNSQNVNGADNSSLKSKYGSRIKYW